MSNAQKYNEALGFVGDDSIKHTDRFNETKRRLFGNGFEFSDEEFAKLYQLVHGTSGEIHNPTPHQISDDEANKLDSLAEYLEDEAAHGGKEWFTFSQLCQEADVLYLNQKSYYGEPTVTSQRAHLKKLFDALIEKHVFKIEKIVFKTNNSPVLYVYRAC